MRVNRSVFLQDHKTTGFYLRGEIPSVSLLKDYFILIEAFHARTSVIPVVYFPVKVISIAKYSRDQSISLTTVPTKREAERRREKRKEKEEGGSQVNSKQKSKFEEGFD